MNGFCLHVEEGRNTLLLRREYSSCDMQLLRMNVESARDGVVYEICRFLLLRYVGAFDFIKILNTP